MLELSFQNAQEVVDQNNSGSLQEKKQIQILQDLIVKPASTSSETTTSQEPRCSSFIDFQEPSFSSTLHDSSMRMHLITFILPTLPRKSVQYDTQTQNEQSSLTYLNILANSAKDFEPDSSDDGYAPNSSDLETDSSYSDDSDGDDSVITYYENSSETELVQILENTQCTENNNFDEWEDINDTKPDFDEFTDNCRPNIPDNTITPADFYSLFLRLNTNNYAQDLISNLSNLKPKSRLRAWTPTTPEEMKKFLGVLLAMGLSRVNSNDTDKLKKIRDTFNKILEILQTLLEPDNFYNSIDLAEELIRKKTFMCGTLRPNRKGNPKKIISIKLKRGQIVGKMYPNGVRVIKWTDKRPVHMISTCRNHNLTLKSTGKTNRITGNIIKKPQCVITYNENKKGIDFNDQMSSYYSSLKRGVKWFRKVMMEILFGTVIINSWVLYNHGKPVQMPKKNFMEAIIEALTQVPILTETGNIFFRNI
ncbi:unnamed protein product [Parnassius apollo]|uniref:(apollo) hypothetical protein n=1 Tax=Parnassius apollo TaxID=110799 RepID=A0A8S3XPN3_PARAO|nr:unnamed protein product [Parnassius apollo]